MEQDSDSGANYKNVIHLVLPIRKEKFIISSGTTHFYQNGDVIVCVLILLLILFKQMSDRN